MRIQNNESCCVENLPSDRRSILALVLLVAPILALAQPTEKAGQAPVAVGKTADEMWLDVQSKTKPKSSELSPITANQRNAGAAVQAGGMRQGAAAAREFYTAFPNHPKATEARKLEAMATLYGVKVGEDAAEREATALGKAFVDNKANTTADRFEVALAMGRLAVTRRIKDRVEPEGIVAWEALADELRAQFGDLPEVHELYLDFARSYDSATAERVANKLLEWPVSAKAKAQATGIIARTRMIGTKIELKLTADDGTTLDFSQAGEMPTVLVVWSNLQGTGEITALKRYQQNSLRGVRLVYVAMAATPEQAAAFKKAPIIPGQHSRLTTPATHLALARLAGPFRMPYAIVLRSDGTLRGFGRMSDIPSLLKGPSQQ